MSKTNKSTNQKNIISSKNLKDDQIIVNRDGNVKSVKISDWVKDLIAVNKATPDFNHKVLHGRHIFEKYSE